MKNPVVVKELGPMVKEHFLLEESNGGLPDECSGVHAVDSGRIGLRDLVQLAVDSGVLGALWVEVVGVDLAAAHAGRHGKGPDAGEDVGDDGVAREEVEDALVLGLEARVPVDLAVVELEPRAVFAHAGAQAALARAGYIAARTAC